MEKNLIFGNALPMAGDATIAGIRRMQELSVQVSSARHLWSQLREKRLRWGKA